ncbi:hypothetical protein HOY82DRAFT_610568 [Tuber indicum]|nr:hypothetical protein HOY82DRAFT_610568 [Tuber indicum]
MSAKIFKEIKDAIKTRSPDSLIFHDVGQEEFDDVLQGLRDPTNYLERHAFRIHWFAWRNYLKVVMPSALHECAGQWIYGEILGASVKAMIPADWVQKVGISASPEYKNFIGKYQQSTMEADLTIVPLLGPDWTKEAKYPSVVLESGWSEPADQLHRDATLWQAGKSFPPPADPVENPSITFEEFFAGSCPPGMDPQGCVVLDLENLRILARRKIIARNSVPDE